MSAADYYKRTVRALRRMIDDEEEAVEEYAFLWKLLQDIGYSREASELERIARDEYNHRKMLQKILERIRV